MPLSPYHQRLYRARRELDAGPRADVLRAVAEHYADLIAELAGQTMNVDGVEVPRGPLTPDDADRIVRALREALRRLTERLAGAIDREAQAAIELAVTAAEEAAASIVKPGSGLIVQADFAAVPERAVEGLFVRRGLDDGYTYAALLRRGAARSQPLLENLVARAVTIGQTGEDLTRDLAAALSDVDPLVRTAARRATGANGRLLKRALLREARLDPNPDVLPAARRLWYEARRVAVTEVNVAFAEADRSASVVSPVVDLLQWTVSGRHDGLPSSPDVCDYLRFANLHGYGPGLYHPALFPALPHPHCACSRKHILRPASDWGKPKRPLPEEVREFDPSAKGKAERATGRERTDEQWMRQAAAGAGRVRLALRAGEADVQRAEATTRRLPGRQDPKGLLLRGARHMETLRSDSHYRKVEKAYRRQMDEMVAAFYPTLTYEQRLSVYAWTNDAAKGAVFRRVNFAHWGRAEHNAFTRAYTEDLVGALNSLPPYEGTLYRAVRSADIDLSLYKEGEVVRWDGFSSTSKEYTYYQDDPRKDVVFEIEGKTGRDISLLSEYGPYGRQPQKDQHEVLYPPGKHFRVTSVQERNGKIVITLVEVET